MGCRFILGIFKLDGSTVKFHPASEILSWCLLVVIMQFLTLGTLLITAGFILLMALLLATRKLAQLLRRTRWIMLSLLLVYAYTTPGQPLLNAFGIFSPSREGLGDGLLQLTRLLSSLAGLAILLHRLERQQLIAGLYTLLAPLRLLHVPRERIAVRLALTLHYAEAAMQRGVRPWQDSLRSLFEPHGGNGQQMELTLYRLRINDGLLLGFMVALLCGVMRIAP